ANNVGALYKRSLFAAVATLSGVTRKHLEAAADRILMLADDYGGVAVKSLLRDGDEIDGKTVEATLDKHSRALYLYLCRLENAADRRFEQAETARQQARQWKSESYASHFRGPVGVAISLDEALKDTLKAAIARLYPQAPLHDVVIEHFQRRDLAQTGTDDAGDDQPATPWLHTIVVGFNGKETHWNKVVDGEVTTHHDQALQRITFSYDPGSGALSVFCDDKAIRRDLARALRDVVLASDSEIGEMPLLEFSLDVFGSAQVFERLTIEPGDGVEHIGITFIKLAKPFEQAGEDSTVHLASHLMIQRDRRDSRNVYTVAYEDYGLDGLTQWTLCQVKMVLRLARQKDRRAHNINVQITAPNGLNDNAKTEDERQLVMRLLKRWNIATEF
ncbi:MAG: hypothetical protein AB7E12_14140, partial [Burkholderiaceae bacterium]